MLRMENLSKSFGGVNALQGVSFSLKAGEALGIVGDNGAGKSTLLKCLSGFLKPDGGTITFNKQLLPYGHTRKIRELGIEMVYQDLALCRQQSVLANVFLGREILTRWGTLDMAAMSKRAQETLGKINEEIPLDTAVKELSGGQQQAVAIARAMLGEPKLVIFDEPTAALGVKESAKVLRFIKSLTAHGVAVIMVSHRIGDVIATTNRVLLMRQGKVVQTFQTAKISAEKIVRVMGGENS